MVSLSDVAAEAKVSVSVVSRVLNDAPGLRIRPETRERVLKTAKRLEYVPNQAARGLRLGMTGTLGLVLPGVTRTFPDLVRGVEDAADSHGQSVLIARSERVDQEGEYLRRLVREGRVDGLVVQLVDRASTDDVVQDLVANLPVVFINARSRQAGSVVQDDIRGTQDVTKHLLALGHTEIGYIGGLPDSYTSTPRERGFISALSEAGLRRRSAWSTALGYTVDAGRDAVDQIWSTRGAKPTALVVANPNAAYGVLAQLRHHGVSVPGDVSVASLNESWVATVVHPTLTTVEMPLYELGVAAIEQLMRRLSGGRMEHEVITSPEPVLHPRESSAPPAG